MPMSTLTVAGINPVLNVLGATQQFNYNQNLSTLQINNIYIPTMSIQTQTNHECRNYLLGGFRWVHLTNIADTYGSFTLQSFVNGSPSGSDYMTFNSDGIELYTDLSLYNNRITNLDSPVSGTDAANKDYVDNKTWTVSDITDFTSAVSAFRLDQFAAPNTSVGFNSQKIINLLNPTNPQDAATKNYVDNKTWTVSQITDYTSATNTLIGAATILPSRISGYPADATTFLRGDGSWSAVPTKAFASIMMTSNATPTTVTTGGTYYKVAGTTASVATNLFTTATDNRQVYTGTPTVNGMVQVSLDATHNALTDTILTFTLFKNGSIASSYSAPVQSNVAASSNQAFCITSLIPLSTGDYTEVFATASSSAVDVTVTNLNFMTVAL